MIASFSYQLSAGAALVGLIVALFLTVVIGMSGRVLLSSLLTAAVWGGIAFIVVLCGDGGLLGLGYLVFGVPAAAGLGAVCGGCWSMVMRRTWKASNRATPKEMQKTGRDLSGAP